MIKIEIGKLEYGSKVFIDTGECSTSDEYIKINPSMVTYINGEEVSVVARLKNGNMRILDNSTIVEYNPYE